MKAIEKTLNDQLDVLLDLLLENHEGFQNANKFATNENLKIYFEKKSQECKEFATELIGEFEFLGILDENESLLDYVKRAWTSIKWVFSTYDDEKIINEIFSAEEELIEQYEAILQLELRPSTQTLLSLQKECIQSNLNYTKQLKQLPKWT
ncbi:MAG TPA: DUF2383 domain-containing protein [Flavobacterium sp.]|uniref:DUF2383 domain-containing protein n=1 Tax=unclassified Flavobacterium TaxID=196869 RepID=UPI0025B84D45|nr:MULTISPECIES: DUF2383 domain-containing protein [unclassified Flavobacterium]HRE78437.1 DUF2383 domain-containing protein [Flavobacterium sp.]